MVHHVFNSSLVSGPELLVLPNLQRFPDPCEIVLLQESRLPRGSAGVAAYARGLGFTVHEFPVAKRLDLAAVRAVRGFWQETRPGIIHAHGPKAALHALLARPKGRERPWLVTTHHGVRANDQSLKLRFFEAIYERLVIPRTDLCLTVCTSDRALLVRRGVPPEKLVVHLNGTSRTLFAGAERTRSSMEVRRAWSGELAEDLSSAFIIGVVGRLSPEKQHDLILRSFARFRAARPEVEARLLCFGSGPLDSALARRTAELNLTGQVRWMGYRPNMAVEMTGLDVLLSVSSAEGLPINLIEAGWAGVPVVANAVGGIRDLIRHQDNGLLLEPPATEESVQSALGVIRDDAEGAARLAERLQAVVRTRFSREAWTERLLEIYGLLPPRA